MYISLVSTFIFTWCLALLFSWHIHTKQIFFKLYELLLSFLFLSMKTRFFTRISTYLLFTVSFHCEVRLFVRAIQWFEFSLYLERLRWNFKGSEYYVLNSHENIKTPFFANRSELLLYHIASHVSALLVAKIR